MPAAVFALGMGTPDLMMVLVMAYISRQHPVSTELNACGV